MTGVVPAEGIILERVLEAAHGVSAEGLSRGAYGRFDAAQMKTEWGRRHRRRFALMDGSAVLASATQYDLGAVLDQQSVRVCGIGDVFSAPPNRDAGHAKELVDRLLDEAARAGAAMALLFQGMSREHQPAGCEPVSMANSELRVTESSRRGAPMTLIRGGEERDRDPSGARVGAILQALIAREPVERRPTIRAWLPRGFVPPQVTIVSAQPSADVLMVRPLGSRTLQPRLSGDDVL